jgi:hypothetical protein
VSVFVIINEWTTVDNSTGSELTGSKYFESEDDAWEALLLIAQAQATTLYADETSLVLEDHDAHLQYEEYYIQELTKGE